MEQNSAQIKIIKNGTVLATPFIDLSPKAGSGGEGGLLGLASHPNYSSNGFFFVNYTDNSGDTVLARYQVSGNVDIADPNSEFIIANLDQPFSNNNGGMLVFSPNDGYLYIFLGDGGSGNTFFNLPIAAGASGITVLLQAVDINTCTKSNLIMDTL